MSTQRISLDQAKTQFSDLVIAASQGGEVIIEENGKALARLISASDAVAYRTDPPEAREFSGDDEALAWDADGWEDIA